MTDIYILRLEGGHYYVGKSDNVEKRYEQHINGYGSAWTRKHKPISLFKTIRSASMFDEDKYTKEYMSKYGIDKVRGGAYVSVLLDDEQYKHLERELFAAQDKCVNCGKKGHFVKACPYTDEDDEDEDDEDEDEEDDEDEEVEADEWGCEYCDRTFTTAFGASVHEKSCGSKKKTSTYAKSSGRVTVVEDQVIIHQTAMLQNTRMDIIYK